MVTTTTVTTTTTETARFAASPSGLAGLAESLGKAGLDPSPRFWRVGAAPVGEGEERYS